MANSLPWFITPYLNVSNQVGPYHGAVLSWWVSSHKSFIIPSFLNMRNKITTSPVALECSSGNPSSPMHLAPGVDPSSRGSAAP